MLSLPGTLNPYPYALNNPLLYTDPSGEFVGAALASGLIGAAFAAAGYAFSHPGQGLECYLRDGDFWRAVGTGAASGLISGFLMGYFAPLSLLATGFGSAMQIGAFVGLLSGGLTYITTSLLFGQPITTQGIVTAMAGGAVFGAIGGALGYWARTARPQPTTQPGAGSGCTGGACNSSGGPITCFVAGTQIATPEGAVAIEAICQFTSEMGPVIYGQKGPKGRSNSGVNSVA